MERHPVVECPDDEVAIMKGGRAVVVMLESVALREPGKVQPVPGPALTVPGGLEKFVDHLCESARRFILQKRLDVFWRGWDPDQIEIRPADERSLCAGRVGTDAAILQLGQDESVDVRLRPFLILNLWRRYPEKRLVSPVLPRGGRDLLLGPRGRVLPGNERGVVRSPVLDPRREMTNRVLG